MSGERGVAVVTGAAGGIGAEVVERLARRFDTVIAADLGDSGLDRGPSIVEISCDVTSREDVDAMVAAAAQAGDLRAVVACAGIVDVGDLGGTTDEGWDRVMDINVTGTMRVCRAALPYLGRGSSIVTVASISGRTASTFASPAYVASKAAVLGLTKSLAKQLGGAGVRVNGVAPGVIETPMIASYGAERKAALLEQIPLHRLGDASDVAQAIEFLATDNSGFITGHIMDVNGGQFIG